IPAYLSMGGWRIRVFGLKNAYDPRPVTRLTAPSSLSIQHPSPADPTPHLPQGVVVPGLYVHIPFCFHKCHYCDFYSITRQTPERMNRFVDLILAEAAMWSTAPATPKPRTIFFGGGTPSLLPLDEMRRLLTGLTARIDLSA